MVKELSYNTIALVVESWENMKRVSESHVAGSILFQ